jgi:hypothetical protein
MPYKEGASKVVESKCDLIFLYNFFEKITILFGSKSSKIAINPSNVYVEGTKDTNK